MSHENLYNVWAKFKNRSTVDQKILRAAGKDNCLMLDGYGECTCGMCDRFLDDLRYCLKPEYIIPKKHLTGMYRFSKHHYECPKCWMLVETDVAPSCLGWLVTCKHCDCTFELEA